MVETIFGQKHFLGLSHNKFIFHFLRFHNNCILCQMENIVLPDVTLEEVNNAMSDY